MRDRFPREIRCEIPLVGHVKYHLPLRRLGWLSHVGWVVVAVWAAVVAGWLAFTFLAEQRFMAAVATVIFSIPFVLASLVPLGIGLALARSRVVIEVGQDELRVTDWIGPYPLRRRWPLGAIQSVEVFDQPLRSNGVPITRGPLHGLGALGVQVGAAKPGLVALAYPLDWLWPLADDLARHLQRAAGKAIEVQRSTAQLNRLARAPAPTQEVIDQPTGSRVVLEAHDNGLSINVPPAGLLRGSAGLFWFALFWNGFMAVFTTFWVFAAGDMPASALLFVFGIIALFWCVGSGLLLAAVNMASRRAAIAVAGSTLMVLRKGIFGTSTHEWDRSQLSAIRVGPSGMSVNDQPVLELQFHQTDGHKFGMLAGRDVPELMWMATHLRLALDVPAEIGTANRHATATD